MRTPTELAARFRAEGRKVTPQRVAVFEALAGNDGHPTAEAVHALVVAGMPMVSLRTVYQVLHDLEDLGELQVLDLGTGSARFDPHVGGHHHLVCTKCGKVRDLVADLDGVVLPAGAEQGFVVERTDVVFRGRCDDCA
jgi:Fe2+ or Zn2+ uptake regulation protein